MACSRPNGVLLVAALAALGPLGSSACRSQVTKPQTPNIVFIFADDHANKAISAYGSVINKTPNIDRIARQGMRFDHCFVTNSLCGPSRACILTGKYSHKNGFFRNGNRFDGRQMTFPKILREHGYQTAVIGKWHLGSDPTGFDYWEILRGQGTYYNPRMKSAKGVHKYTGYTTDIVTDLALQWLDKGRDKSKPFVLMFQHKAPHRNWQPDAKHLHMYDDVTIPEPATFWDDYSGRASPAHTQKMMVAKHLSPFDLKLRPPRNLTAEQLELWNAAYGPKNAAFRKAELSGKDLVRWKYQRYIKDYLRCVASVDDNVGRLLDYLDAHGEADNTIVIYSSDQGWYLGEHGWFDKRWMYEESLHTPLLIRWPGVIQPGSTNQDFVSNLDFAETFLDIAGLAEAIPADMQGRSFVPLLKGATPSDWRQSFYYHYYEFPGSHAVAKHYGVRTRNYKLIHYYRVGEWELFDLEKDPHELHSVYADPAYAAVVTRLKAELARLQQKLDDTHPQRPVPGDPETRKKKKKKRK